MRKQRISEHRKVEIRGRRNSLSRLDHWLPKASRCDQDESAAEAVDLFQARPITTRPVIERGCSAQTNHRHKEFAQPKLDAGQAFRLII
jgi:hypothetical protein